MQKAAKANLLDHFYDHLEEQDWLEGVDLYQAGRVGSVQTYEGLISGRVSGVSSGNADVRLKIHPAGHCIQWIECTCRKNRTFGQYCEHIAGFMIHVDRERPELFSNLDSTMPLKPPVAPRKPRATQTIQQQISEEAAEIKNRMSGATQAIIDRLQGSIHAVSLMAHGPTLRVRIEIKPGHITHYDLGLDAAAKFLASHKHLETATSEVRELKIFEEEVELGTRIYQPEPEKIVAERVIAIRLGKKQPPALDKLKLPHEIGKHRRLVQGTLVSEAPQDNYLLLSIKGATKYIGEEYFFLQGKGYYPLNRKATSTAFSELPLTKTYKEDDAAEFIKGGFYEFIGVSPIFLDESLKNPIILDAPVLSEIQILEGSDGWFRLDPRYGKGKAQVSMVELMKQYRKKKRKYVRSGDGWMKIPDFVTEHQWELDEAGESLKVDALGLMRLRAAIGDFDHFVGSKRSLDQMREKIEFTPEQTVPVPHDTNINLREYQDMGLRWFWWLYKNGLHGLLADEMGLGKTHQAMALMAAIQKEKPDARFLVIAPTTVLDHWADKVEQFAPVLKPIKFHGPKRAGLLREIDKDKCLLITSYGVMLRDLRHLQARTWDALILDEAHFVKNNDTATYQAACRLKARVRLCLTGTPMENHLGELKSIFDFLVPGYLGSDEYFRKQFINPMEKGDAPEVTLALQKLIHPFKMRRTKDQVLKDLPAKVEDLRHCALSDEQVKMYRDVVAMKAAPLVAQLQDDKTPIPYLHVFATLTLLKQICNHPALISRQNWEKHESGKFELMKELIDEALGSDHKIVIFSQYVGMIEIITKYLTKQGIGHVTLTGQTRNRGEVIKNFQTKPELKVFCGSLLAGGIGIDLTAASVVIHYDRWWNATKENQATDRVHRIGQNKNVQVMKLVTRGTLEEKIDRMINSKKALFEKFLDQDEEVFKTLSRSELIELLQ